MTTGPASLSEGTPTRASTLWPDVAFSELFRPNRRPYALGPTEDANLVGMRLYGGGPFHRELKAATKIQKKSHFVIRAGDVIYNKLFAWKGTFGVVPDELDGMFVSDKFPTYEHDHERLDLQYLEWYFRYPPLWEQARQMSTGSAALSKLTLNPPRFMDLTIPLPPLNEQRRIVEQIERLAAKITLAVRLRRTLATTDDALFLSAIDQCLEALGSGYSAVPLAHLVEHGRGISYGIVQTGKPHAKGVLTLRAGDLQRFEVRLEDVKRVDPILEAKYQRTRLAGGEVLLRIRGGLGEVAVTPPEMVGGNVSREIAVIPVLKHLDPEYVMFAMSAPSSQEFLRQHIRGTSYQGINLRDVRRLTIPVPPLSEQRRAVASLKELKAKIDRLKALQQKTAAELDALLPSILDKAFKGEP